MWRWSMWFPERILTLQSNKGVTVHGEYRYACTSIDTKCFFSCCNIKCKLLHSYLVTPHTHTHSQTGVLTRLSHTPVTVCGGWDEGRWGHLSTAAAMSARTCNAIGRLGWRLPWFPFPICAADLPPAMPSPENAETVQPHSPDSRLVVRVN